MVATLKNFPDFDEIKGFNSIKEKNISWDKFKRNQLKEVQNKKLNSKLKS